MLIVVSGKKRSGKDTFYSIAKRTIKDKVVLRYAFADPVKEYAKHYFRVDETHDKEKYRHILQGIGQMMREEVKLSYWIDIISEQMQRDFDTHGEENVVAVVTDARYRNEAEWALGSGGYLIRVVRPELFLPDSHPSEVDLDTFDFQHTIENTGDLKNYTRRVKTWIRENVLT